MERFKQGLSRQTVGVANGRIRARVHRGINVEFSREILGGINEKIHGNSLEELFKKIGWIITRGQLQQELIEPLFCIIWITIVEANTE